MSPDNSEALSLILRRIDQLFGIVEKLTPAKMPQLLTFREAAEAGGVSVDTIQRACDRRELRFIQDRPRAAKRIAVEDLRKWIDLRAVGPVRRKGA